MGMAGCFLEAIRKAPRRLKDSATTHPNALPFPYDPLTHRDAPRTLVIGTAFAKRHFELSVPWVPIRVFYNIVQTRMHHVAKKTVRPSINMTIHGCALCSCTVAAQIPGHALRKSPINVTIHCHGDLPLYHIFPFMSEPP